MSQKAKNRESHQLGLLEQAPPHVELSVARKQQLAPLIEALMIEIAAALAKRESADEQNHR